MVVAIGECLQRRAAPFVQGVEQHLPHRLRSQHPGVVGLSIRSISRSAAQNMASDRGTECTPLFCGAGAGRASPSSSSNSCRVTRLISREKPMRGCSGRRSTRTRRAAAGSSAGSGWVVAKHLVRQIAHLVPLQDHDHPRLIEHRGAAVVFSGVDEAHLIHRRGVMPGR